MSVVKGYLRRNDQSSLAQIIIVTHRFNPIEEMLLLTSIVAQTLTPQPVTPTLLVATRPLSLELRNLVSYYDLICNGMVVGEHPVWNWNRAMFLDTGAYKSDMIDHLDHNGGDLFNALRADISDIILVASGVVSKLKTLATITTSIPVAPHPEMVWLDVWRQVDELKFARNS